MTREIRFTSWVGSALVAAAVFTSLGGCRATPTQGRADPTPVAAVSAPASPAPASAPEPAAAGRPPSTQILEGTERFTAAPLAQSAPSVTGTEGIQLSFVDTDVAIVAGAVLGDGLGLPYVIDPQVKGTLTLQSARPIPKDQLLSVLEAALRTRDLALVPVAGTYHVEPLKDAARAVESFRLPESRGQPGFGVEVVPLQFVSATEMQRLLEPLAPPGGVLRADEARAMLLLAGTGQELSRMLDIVHTFDVDWLAGMSFGLFSLNYVDAKTLTTELQEVFGDAKSPIAGTVRLVPIPRLNSILAITAQPGYLHQVEAWIKRLDLGGTSPGRRIYVYEVQNGRASDLAKSLKDILSLGGETEPSRSLGSSGSLGISTPGISSMTGASAPPAPKSASALSESNLRPTAMETGSLRIVPNEESNSLLILATPSEFSVIEAALSRIDTAPLQVLIEASLAEVTLNDQMQYGLQWSYPGSHGPVVLSQSSSGGIAQSFPGFSYLYSGSSGIQAVLNSLQTVTTVHVISSPKLLVLNNHEATLDVGDQVPVAVQSSVGTVDANAPIVNSVQMQDTGVILHVTPRVNKNGLVFLDISQEVSDVVPTTSSAIDSPTIEERKISTVVSLHSNETVALGGLITESKTKSSSGVPLLSRIPIIGGLFGSIDNTKVRTELIVLITPRVLRSGDDTASAMHDLRNEFDDLKRSIPEPTPKAK